RPGIPSKKAVEAQIAAFNAGKAAPHWYEDDTIYKMWEDLLQITDSKAYDEQLRKIGNYKFESFEIIPLFDVYIEGTRSASENLILVITVARGVPCRHGNTACLTAQGVGTDPTRSANAYSGTASVSGGLGIHGA